MNGRQARTSHAFYKLRRNPHNAEVAEVGQQHRTVVCHQLVDVTKVEPAWVLIMCECKRSVL